MDNFLNILTAYQSSGQRSVEKLATVYHDSGKLKTSILSLIKEELIDTALTTGKRVLLKPNWVLHNRAINDDLCLRTNEAVIVALLEIVLDQRPSEVVIGDAPLQGCNWLKMLPGSFYDACETLSRNHNVPVKIKDFRRVTFDRSTNDLIVDRKSLTEYSLFDLGGKSFLEEISHRKGNFRVADYNPDRLTESHCKGTHKYCITKDAFDSDIIVSMPKLKTHQKAGITAALKNIVGINGDKDYLPHHRMGGTGFNGDCYPGKNYLRLAAEKALDMANRNIGKKGFWFWSKLSAVCWKLSLPTKVHDLGAAWYGNDTTWRMVMDLNQIIIYGRSDGTLSDRPQRKLYSLGDGIIGGQGDGPLRPEPLPMGILTFSDNSFVHDYAVGAIMRLPVGKIPLLRASKEHIDKLEYTVCVNGERSSMAKLELISLETLPPPGWADYLRCN